MAAIGFDNDKYLSTQSEQIKRRIAQFGGKIEKSGLVFDDALVKTFHWELPGHDARLMGCLHCHQNGVPFLFQGPTVRSSRN